MGSRNATVSVNGLSVSGKPYSDLHGAGQLSSEIRKPRNQKSSTGSGTGVSVLLFLSSLKLICEIALMALMGQGLLALLAGEKRDKNLFYQLLTILTKPFRAAARFITPRQVADQHVGFVAFFLMLIVWAVVTFEKIRLCVSSDLVGCR